ncbi:DUF4231 domain-containing protein [Actinomadura geliboluensis]|nr:DUF4231 domain-containing protein [Actinomadura geliboluensis]
MTSVRGPDLLYSPLDDKIRVFNRHGVTDAATDPAREEGPSTAAYDFNDARFRIHDFKEAVHQAESSRRRWRALLAVAAPALLAVLLVLNLARFADRPPVHIDLAVLVAGDAVTAAALLAVVISSIRGLAATARTIAGAQLQLARLRDAERDARTRMVSGGLTRLLWIYHSDVLTTIEEYRGQARKYRTTHNRFQTIIIVGSLATTIATTAAAGNSPPELVATALSFAVGVSAGMTGYFKFRERSMNLQQAADDLDLEYRSAELGIHAYRNLAEQDRLIEFAQRAETIKNEQRKREQQLEQPPEGNSASAGTSGTSA